MFLALAFVLSQPPAFEVVNLCPPTFAVENKCPAVAARVGYPVRGSLWSHPGEIHSHLKSAAHAGKWPAAWVDGLTNAEAEAVHSDDHEGRVKWDFIPGASKAPVPVPYTPRLLAPQWCPGGT